GRVSDIRQAYAAGHVFVLCSISEGFPYTLIGAMACGRACVGTDVGGVSEALGDAAVLLVPPRSPAALAAACVRLLRDDDLRRTLGANARVRAVEHFTVDRAISAFDELYTLVGSGAGELAAAGGQPALAVAARPPAAGPRPGESPSPPPRWLALPPDEEATLVMPWPGPGRPDLAGPVPPDQEVTQTIPALGRGVPPDSEP